MTDHPIETAVILCGGRGTRLGNAAQTPPKALVAVAGKPIVWHVMQSYISAGIRRFVICTGYQYQHIHSYFEDNKTEFDAEIICVNTGLDTPTGGRLKQVVPMIKQEQFCVTYGDGVADINITEQIQFHLAHGLIATVTAVRPPLPFGVLELSKDGMKVSNFEEKPRSDRWINGGFFCFNGSVINYLSDTEPLEAAPLKQLALAGQLAAYRHNGFWACMDTQKEVDQLNQLCSSGNAHWLEHPLKAQEQLT